jgi:ABC-2 type transport system permease protein
MSIRRVLVLLGKELVWGPKNMFFIFALVIPLVVSLLINLLVGTFFSGKPRLGIVDVGRSELTSRVMQLDGLQVQMYSDSQALREATANGSIDLGLVLPAGLDQAIKAGVQVELTGYIWGESLIKDRATLGMALVNLLREISGQKAPVEIVTETLGEGQSVPWDKRLFPFVVLMSLFFGGAMIPATSLVEEKQNRTLVAVINSSTSLGEVFLAKGILGLTISVVMSLVILAINQAFGEHMFLLVALLIGGATMAVTFGILLGAFIRDVNTLFAVIKAIGLLLYAPAFLYMFPDIPQWIGRIFPTYYAISPIIQVSQEGAGFNQVRGEITILILLILILLGLVGYVVKAWRKQPTIRTAIAG